MIDRARTSNRLRPATQRFEVLIAGGGFAALETGLALRALAGRRVSLTFVSPDPILRYRPAATTELFDPRPARGYDLRAIAAELGADLHVARLESATPRSRQVRLSSGARLPYDALVLAIGCRARASVPGARAFRDQRDVPAVRRLVARLESQRIRRIVFAVPPGTSWPLPLYELALLTMRREHASAEELDVTLVTPESQPLEVFGPSGSRAVADWLDEQGVRFLGGRVPASVRRDGALELQAAGALPAGCVVTVPQLTARRIPGIPASWWGFVPTDEYGRVEGLADVYAVGDMTAFPVKQGGLATQQADRVARVIARGLGAEAKEETNSRWVLEAHLVGGPKPLFLRTELDWQGHPISTTAHHLEHAGEAGSAKVLGRYLAPYLEGLDRTAA